MAIEFAHLHGRIIETKREVIDGVDTGRITGHIASWQVDDFPGPFGVPDRLVKGAYIKSLQEHKARHNRQIRFKLEHTRLIGGFPIKNAMEDNIGLLATGHVNLETQLGIETYALARQEVLVDLSVGHLVKVDRIEGDERLILEADIFEGSITEEPKNRRSRITEVKNIAFSDLPLAGSDQEWNEQNARERIMELKFVDGNGADAFIGEYVIADVINGKLMAVPAALHIAAEEVQAIEDKSAQMALERYFGKMKETSPFETKKFFTVSDVKDWTNAEFKTALTDTGVFSNGAIRALIARSKDQVVVPESDNKAMESLLEKIHATNANL